MNDESIPGEGLMADVKCAGHKEEFFSINSGTDPNGRLANDMDRCRHVPFHLCLPV